MKKITVLITAASRRVPLVRAFRTAVEKFGKGRVITTDINPLSPAGLASWLVQMAAGVRAGRRTVAWTS
jgi:hypothetical protein